MFNRYFHNRATFFPHAVWIIALWLGLTRVALAATDADGIQGTSTSGSAASNLGAALATMCGSSWSFANIFDYVAYTAGVWFVVIAIYHFYLHAENPKNHRMTTPLMLCLGATGLLMLPAVLATVADSMGYAVDPTMAACFDGGAVAGGTGLDGMLAGFIGNIKQPMMAFIQVTANVAGVYMMVRGLIKAGKYGSDPKTHSVNSILANIGFGAILFTIGGTVSMITNSVLGGSSDTSVLSWSSTVTDGLGGASAQFQTAVNAALSFVQIIGFIAFVRGWMIMKKVVEGGGNVTPAQGITHIVGGVLAINIFDFLKAMDTTFGTNLLS